MFRRVVVLLVDGLRPDAVTVDRMPSLYHLGAKFVRAAHATTVRPSTTVAALTSLVTGVSPRRHGLTDAGVPPITTLAGVEPLPRLLRRCGLAASVVAAELPLIRRWMVRALTAVAGIGKLSFADPDPVRMADAVIAAMERAPRGLILVYFPHCDQAGHAHGWMSPAYLRAVRRVDETIGILAPVLVRELAIVLSDHGGGGAAARDHDTPHPLNDRIPLILAGRRLPQSAVIERGVSLLDVPVTIAEALGVPVPSSYEGSSLLDLVTRAEVAAA